MENLNFITPLDAGLSASISLHDRELNAGYWVMRVRLFYDGKEAGKTSFNLHGYSKDEAEDLAKNFKSNPYLMKEVDELLWGESD